MCDLDRHLDGIPFWVPLVGIANIWAKFKKKKNPTIDGGDMKWTQKVYGQITRWKTDIMAT